jgi:hypothetical protein
MDSQRLTAGGVLFLVVVRHDGWLVCVDGIKSESCLVLGLGRVRVCSSGGTECKSYKPESR